MTAREPILCVENFVAGYGENVLLDKVSFAVNRGEVFMIVAGSGCGKSTLMKHLIALYALIEGRVLIGSADIAKAGEGTPQELRDASDSALVRRFFRREA